MMLEPGQASVGGLVLGVGTNYELKGFNPWARSARHDQQPRAWGRGAWSGREDTDSVVIPMRIKVVAEPDDPGDWQRKHRVLCAAFAATSTDVELRYRLRGSDPAEYVMWGRPRLVNPEIEHLGNGVVWTAAGFEALDPLVYAAELGSESTGLPTSSGGLRFPLRFPTRFEGTTESGSVILVNEGTAPAGLLLTITGPATDPVVAVSDPADPTDVQTFRLTMTIAAGQWVTVDTERHTVILNGDASRRGQFAGVFPTLPGADVEPDGALVATTRELSWTADTYHADALLAAQWRAAWL